jgi:hypothetical protein
MNHFKITAIFKTKSQIELKCLDTGAVYYYKFFNGIPSDLLVGERFSLPLLCSVRVSKVGAK